VLLIKRKESLGKNYKEYFSVGKYTESEKSGNDNMTKNYLKK
jgi:hypothetical protein